MHAVYCSSILGATVCRTINCFCFGGVVWCGVVLLWKCVFQHTNKQQNGVASDEPQYYRRTDKTTAFRNFLSS
jgi:hypothetical protein